MDPLKYLYGLAVVLLPLSYDVKILFGLKDITWVSPALLICLALFVLIRPPIKPRTGGLAVAAALISMLVGYSLLPGNLYDALREPVRFMLCFIFFAVSLHFWRRDERFIVRCLVIAVTWQFWVALEIWMAMLNWIRLPQRFQAYVIKYFYSQSIWFGSVRVPRMVGTFIEGPPFGLFMLAALVIFLLANRKQARPSMWLRWGILVSAVGVVGSLSDEIFLGAALLAILCIPVWLRSRRRISAGAAALALALALGPYVGLRLVAKVEGLAAPVSQRTMFASGMERAYLSRYAVELMRANPLVLFLGLGPGRFGEYAQRLGPFPKSVTPQVMFVEWAVGYGIIGFCVMSAWLAGIGRLAMRNYGWEGAAVVLAFLVADGFQANWLWESFFLLLAYVAATGPGLLRVEDAPEGDLALAVRVAR